MNAVLDKLIYDISKLNSAANYLEILCTERDEELESAFYLLSEQVLEVNGDLEKLIDNSHLIDVIKAIEHKN